MTTAEYDFLADAFYRETGIMAPGKDVAPAMCGGANDEQRETQWHAWLMSSSGMNAQERFCVQSGTCIECGSTDSVNEDGECFTCAFQSRAP